MAPDITEEEIKSILLEVIGIVNEARLGRDRNENIEDALFHLKVVQHELDFIQRGYEE